jgi:hypothetical protein
MTLFDTSPLVFSLFFSSNFLDSKPQNPSRIFRSTPSLETVPKIDRYNEALRAESEGRMRK